MVHSRRSTFKVEHGSPGSIDLTTVYDGDPTALETKAMFIVQGDELHYCIGAPGRPRPETFRTQTGDGNTSVVLRRVNEVLPAGLASWYLK